MRFDDGFFMKKAAKGYFVVGTDTGVGKTVVSASLLIALARYGFKTAAIKPIACGCRLTSIGLCNEDALMLQEHATHKVEYSQTNPFAFAEPIAPHIAAARIGVGLTVAEVLLKTQQVLSSDVDYIVIEGAGGLCVPLNRNETMTDLIKGYGYPVILVVGIRLGCINHALLTLESLCKHNVKIAGWVANVIDPEMGYVDESIQCIKLYTKSPLLGVIPYQEKIDLNMSTGYLSLHLLVS
ncbi:MAG: Dethiobiotin synthetase [uncultured bacterium]|nr:MAG: Dethiobiotin synthetase [uncultured bacterium]